MQVGGPTSAAGIVGAAGMAQALVLPRADVHNIVMAAGSVGSVGANDYEKSPDAMFAIYASPGGIDSITQKLRTRNGHYRATHRCRRIVQHQHRWGRSSNNRHSRSTSSNVTALPPPAWRTYAAAATGWRSANEVDEMRNGRAARRRWPSGASRKWYLIVIEPEDGAISTEDGS